MKKMVVAVALAALACGCGSSERDKKGRLIAERRAEDTNSFIVKENGCSIMFKYVIVDKHEYLVAMHDRGIGIAHSPNCQCRK